MNRPNNGRAGAGSGPKDLRCDVDVACRDPFGGLTSLGGETTMEWQRAIELYRDWMADASPETLRIYVNYLLRLAAVVAVAKLGPFDVGIDELASFLAVTSWSPATRKSARSAVRSFYRWAHVTGRMANDPSLLLRPVRVPASRPRPTPDDVLEQALERAIPRDKLMVMLAAYEGLRRAEIACVHTDHVWGPWLRVRGKGGRERDVWLHPVVADAIARRPKGHLFPGLIDGHISPDRVGRILKDLLPGHWTGHTLRHRFCSRGYAGTRDVRAVQQLAGHAKLDTTMVYTQVPDGSLQLTVLAAGPTAA